jgi:hypothetical protein
MQGRGEALRLLSALLAAAGAIAAGALTPSAARAQPTGVQAASTAGTAPLVDEIPIKRTPGKARRVVLSLGPGQFPPLATGGVLRASAEIKVSTTCPARGPRCIGRRYDFSPKFSAQIVLAGSRNATHGSGVYAVTQPLQHGCGQRRPNRNHHCVLTLPAQPIQVPGPDVLPCLASGCHLNLIVGASSPRAKGGNVIVIGGDRPNGTINPTGGRLNAIVIPPNQPDEPVSLTTATPASPTIPLGSKHGGYHTVIYSVELDGLAAGDVLDVNALQRTDISQFDKPVNVGSKIILAGSPGGTQGKPAYATAEGQITPANGFNCTQGPSPYRTPCRSYKTGVVTITQTPLTRTGAPKPLFVNLLSRTFFPCQGCRPPSRASRSARRGFGGAGGEPVSVVEPGGYLSVARYPAAP